MILLWGSQHPRLVKKIARTAEQNLTITDDNRFAALKPDLSPSLAILDGLQRVIRIGSLSKTLSAAARCGFVVARPDLIEMGDFMLGRTPSASQGV